MSENHPENPLLAVDVIIRKQRRIVLIERKNYPRGWAIPGGFVEEGETVENAARREIREEVNLELENLRQWKVFSDPERDPRRHVVSVCFTARGKGALDARTDASNVELFSPHDPLPELAFDHERILECYRYSRWIPSLSLTGEAR